VGKEEAPRERGNLVFVVLEVLLHRCEKIFLMSSSKMCVFCRVDRKLLNFPPKGNADATIAIFSAAADPNLLFFTDSVDAAATQIQTHVIDRFGLLKRRVSQRSRFLWE
jgi:hypothetical protein